MKQLLLFVIFFPILLFAQNKGKKITRYGIDTNKYVPKGIEVGQKAPLINATSVNGKVLNTDEIRKEKNVVLIFYRGKWCPVCNRYLNNLNDSLQYITDKGAEILVIGPESFDNAEKLLKKSNAGFILIPDTNLKILTDYDVLFNVTKSYQKKVSIALFTSIAKNNNQEEAILPVPATYIIGKDGNIIYRHFDYDYTVRASVSEIIDHLE